MAKKVRRSASQAGKTTKKPAGASRKPTKSAVRRVVRTPPAPVTGGRPAARSPVPAKAAPSADGWLAVGSLAPDFTLPDHAGVSVSLAALRGKPVVIFFYPKDDTPGCTVEACGFRDAAARFGKRGAVVIGISPDGPASHARFRTKHNLPFTLLADEAHTVAERFGAWREKSLYGRKYMGIARSTFIIDAKGRVARVFTTVKPAGHADEVLGALTDLG
ncbi:MAG: thioredoxin-dependent thiol peroxidase [Planctomycetota bacterium]